jgi:cytochrome c553
MAVTRFARRMQRIRRAVFLLCPCTGLLCAPAVAPAAEPARIAARIASCEPCHGTPQRPPPPGLPSLAGQPREFLALQMFLLREGLRDVPQMAQMMDGLSDQDLLEIATHFARQPPLPRPGERDPQRYARGAALAKAMGCGSCHLGDYRGQQHVPRLANQREDYLAAAMKAYRDNRRTGLDTSMNSLLYRVPDADIEALAHYLAHR